MCLALLLAQSLPAHAEEQITPLRRAAILLRAVCYDQNLKARAGPVVTVAVVARAGDAGSLGEAAEMLTAFQKVIETTSSSSLQLKVARLDYSDHAAFEAGLKQLEPSVLYVSDGLGPQLEAIKAVARERKILTVCGRNGPVRAGLSVGVYGRDGKSSMIVNLVSSRAEGAAFPPEFLRLAEVIN